MKKSTILIRLFLASNFWQLAFGQAPQVVPSTAEPPNQQQESSLLGYTAGFMDGYHDASNIVLGYITDKASEQIKSDDVRQKWSAAVKEKREERIRKLLAAAREQAWMTEPFRKGYVDGYEQAGAPAVDDFFATYDSVKTGVLPSHADVEKQEGRRVRLAVFDEAHKLNMAVATASHIIEEMKLPQSEDDAPQRQATQLSVVPSDMVQASQTATPSNQRLHDVKTIFVAPLGNGEGAELIRQKIINRLIASGDITVVDSSDAADAILIGASELRGRNHLYADLDSSGGIVSGGTRYYGTCAVRLIGKNKQVLWIEETSTADKRSRSSRRSDSVTSSLADKIVSDLDKAMAADKNQNETR